MDKILIGDIPETVKDIVSRSLLAYSVGLLGGPANCRPNEMQVIGSGTLIQVNNLKAILTADHVLGHLQGNEIGSRPHGTLGILLIKPDEVAERRPLLISISELQHEGRLHQIARELNKEKGDGPDLGLVVLSDTEARRVRQSHNFYNLAASAPLTSSLRDRISDDLLLLTGVPEAETRWSLEEIDNIPYVPSFNHVTFWASCDAAQPPTESGFDYLSVNIPESEAIVLPKGPNNRTNLGGMSGGGVWSVPLFKNGEYRPDLMIAYAVLSGMVFGDQRLRDEDRILSIMCHGVQSLYGQVLPFLQNLASNVQS